MLPRHTEADASDAKTHGYGRVARKRAQRTRQILKAAVDVIAERGYHATNLDEIADRLDLTRASLYHYFPSKEALVSECIEQLGAEATTRLEQLATSAQGSPRDRLRALLVDQLTMLVQDYPETGRLFLHPQDWPQHQRELLKKLRQRHDQVFRTIIEQGAATGEFEVTSVDVTLHCLHGALNYTPTWYRATSSATARRRAIEQVADTVLKLVEPTRSTQNTAATGASLG